MKLYVTIMGYPWLTFVAPGLVHRMHYNYTLEGQGGIFTYTGFRDKEL